MTATTTIPDEIPHQLSPPVPARRNGARPTTTTPPNSPTRQTRGTAD
jgi:hypothetical protein